MDYWDHQDAILKSLKLKDPEDFPEYYITFETSNVEELQRLWSPWSLNINGGIQKGKLVMSGTLRGCRMTLYEGLTCYLRVTRDLEAVLQLFNKEHYVKGYEGDLEIKETSDFLNPEVWEVSKNPRPIY